MFDEYEPAANVACPACGERSSRGRARTGRTPCSYGGKGCRLDAVGRCTNGVWSETDLSTGAKVLVDQITDETERARRKTAGMASREAGARGPESGGTDVRS